MGKNTDIETFDSSWNAAVGCIHGCDFCYAKRIAERFAGFDNTEENRHKYAITGYKGQNIYTIYSPMTRTTKSGEKQTAVYPFGFAPTLFAYNLAIPMAWTEPKDIFVSSMGDLFCDAVPDEWITSVFKACDDAPQHRYFFLTKNPGRYLQLFEKGLIPKNLKNKWFGTSVTDNEKPYFYLNSENAPKSALYDYADFNGFLSVEPILGDFDVNENLQKEGIKWVIVGAETGNRVGKVRPKREWVSHIAESCELSGIPLFMKNSLQSLMKDDFIQEKP